MDSTLILADVKWVLAELVRQASGLPPAETQKMVDEIIERRLDVLWKHGDITRVLDPTIPAREQVLLLLYDKSPQKVEELRTAVEYANPTNFKRIVKRLHVERLIDYNADTGICIITSRGVVRAETIARDRSVLK
jgi:hypothetical protein